nr:hypothetical protein [Acidobacteriota bacterium]
MVATARSPVDLPTVASISIVALLVQVLSHEAVGHGGVCWIAGAPIKGLSALALSADTSHLAAWQFKSMCAAGSVVNLLVAFGCLGILRSRLSLSPHLRYFLWVTMVLDFLLPGGYMTLSWWFGDWHEVPRGLPHEGLWNLVLTLLGAVIYWFGMNRAADELEPFLGSTAVERQTRARLLASTVFLTCGLVAALAPLLGRAGAVSVMLG